MIYMEVYLSLQAQKDFKLLQAMDSDSRGEGLLLGHKSGGRYFVERIFSTPNYPFPSLEKYLSMEQLFNGQILGFFSFSSKKEKPEKILAPVAYRKLFLQVESQKKNLKFNSFIIEYDHNFFLAPVKLISA